jgi:type I restriction enzyme R subunit
VRLLDFENPEHNHYVVTDQFVFRAGPAERRADLVLFVNGLPLVVIEAKTPVRAGRELARRREADPRRLRAGRPRALRRQRASAWPRGQGADVRIRSRMPWPVNLWGPWRERRRGRPRHPRRGMKAAVLGLLAPLGAPRHPRALHPLRHRQEEAPDEGRARYQQYEAVNLIVQRVLAGGRARA